MSKESEKIYEILDKYIARMSELRKQPSALYVTGRQLKALKDNFKKSQKKGGLLAATEFRPDYKGFQIEVYRE